jgi:hypothetical protein
MTRIIHMVAILCVCAGCSSRYFRIGPEIADAVVVHDNVGDVIDAGEREYYTLYPGVTDFVEARYYEAIRGYYVEIVTSTNKIISLNRDSRGLAILHDYIERYDEYRQSEMAYELKWEIVDYDELGHPISRAELNSDIVQYYSCLTGGCLGGCLGMLSGCILIATFSEDFDPYDDLGDDLAAGASCAIGGTAGCLFGFGVTLLTIPEHKKLSLIRQSRKPWVERR